LFENLSTRKWTRKGHYNILLSLNKDEDVLYNQMHKERKRNVQTAIKNGLTFQEVKTPEDIKSVVALIQQTYARKHVPISYLDMFDQVLEIMGDYAHFIACYTSDGKMIGGQVRLCYKEMIYAWFAGSDEAYFKQRPNDFLMWNAILWAKSKGYEVFDFGGGGEPGVEYGVRDYKMKYGCEIFDYGRMLYTHRPLIYFFAQTAYKLYHKLKGK
jgi:lipid II:glycine glycyltransferase (peptidoglycan interpeptide bridge formation enzyme)